VTKIWWLASYPKSGNTWLRLFLSAYRNGGEVNINRPLDAAMDDIQDYFYQSVSPVALADLSDEHLSLLRPTALLSLCAIAPESKPLLVKTHTARCAVDGIDTIPISLTHGAVYLIRDPRDVAVSYAAHRGVSIDELIKQMQSPTAVGRRDRLYHVLSGWSEHVKSWVADSRYPVLAVRYEDLCEKPEYCFKQILTFLRHEIDNTRLQQAVDATRFDVLQAQEQASGFREATKHGAFFRSGQPGNWREALTQAQAAQITETHGAMMREFGYGD
jgi:hypothetical protein